MKHALAAASLILLGATLAGCGGDDSDTASSESSASSSESPSTPDPSAPSSGASVPDASSSDFCAALISAGSLKNGKDVAALASDLKKAGTPDGITDDAKSGFDVYVGVLRGIDKNATAKELKKLTDLGLSANEETEVQSFLTYASTACSGAAAGSGG